MVGKVRIGGKDINAIVIDTYTIGPREYRHSLINALKVAVLNPQCELEGDDICNVLNIIQATEDKEEGGDG